VDRSVPHLDGGRRKELDQRLIGAEHVGFVGFCLLGSGIEMAAENSRRRKS
jgi:hypothetical protein